MADINSTGHARNFKDLTGCRFGLWAVLSLAPRDTWTGGRTQWICRCECGAEHRVFSSSLLRGMSHGCMRCSHTTHDEIRSREYRAWKSMRQRCIDPKYASYRNYGGRGISICDRWGSFTAFLSDMGRCPEGFTLDRINTDGDYEPSNCRWATYHTQNRNKRNNRLLCFDGRTQCLRDWEHETGLNYNTIWNRLDRGWTVEEALTTPPGAPRKRRA